MSGKTSHSHTYSPHTVPATKSGPKCELPQWNPGKHSNFCSSVVGACITICPFPCPPGPNPSYWRGATQATNKISPWRYDTSFWQLQVLLFPCLLTHSLYQGLSYSVSVRMSCIVIVLSATARYIQSPKSLLRQSCDVSSTEKTFWKFAIPQEVFWTWIKWNILWNMKMKYFIFSI